MNRFNYLAPSHDAQLARVLGTMRGIDFTTRTQVAFLLFAIAAVGSSAFALWQSTELRQSQLHLAVARARFSQAEKRLQTIAPITRTIETLEATAARVADIRGRTSARLQMVANLGDALTTRVWLVSLREDDEGSLMIRGRAQNLADLGNVMDDLRGQRALQSPSLEKIHALPTTSDNNVIEFDVAMREKL